MLSPYEWSEYLLQVVYSISERMYSVFLEDTSQEEFIEWYLRNYSEYPLKIVSITSLSPESFELLVANAKRHGHSNILTEGEQ